MPNKKTIMFNKLYLKSHSGNRLWKVFYTIYTQYVLGCDIKCNTIIGDGFEIFHSAHGSVVSPTTVIGKNVSLRQNTTIGAKGFDGADRSPIIEDNVTIGPNVCIIGDIKIGHDSIIGAGAVVVKDVPPYAVVAGNPAKIIKMLNNTNFGGVIFIVLLSLILQHNVALRRAYGQSKIKKDYKGEPLWTFIIKWQETYCRCSLFSYA